MDCQVCNRRMRSGTSYFECDGCGSTAEFVPIEEVLPVLDEMKGPQITKEELDAALDSMEEAEKKSKKSSKSKGKKK